MSRLGAQVVRTAPALLAFLAAAPAGADRASSARRTHTVQAVERAKGAVVNINAQEVVKARVSQDPFDICLLYTSPSPRDLSTSRMPSSA